MGNLLSADSRTKLDLAITLLRETPNKQIVTEEVAKLVAPAAVELGGDSTQVVLNGIEDSPFYNMLRALAYLDDAATWV